MYKFVVATLILLLSYGSYGAEHNPYTDERYREINDPTLRLATESMGGFIDAMKSFIIYTAAQNIPGTKESGVGYYFDNNTKKMKRSLFFRMSRGYPEQTNKPLNFRIDGTGFFVIELPGGWPAFTQDGRFELDDSNRLVTLSNGFPVLGENGYIRLPSDDVVVDKGGIIFVNNDPVDRFRIEYPKHPSQLNSYNQSIFYLAKHEYDTPGQLVPAKYEIQQGFVETSSVTKAYIGLVPEWQNGHEANVRMIKSYVRNMSSAVQLANP